MSKLSFFPVHSDTETDVCVHVNVTLMGKLLSLGALNACLTSLWSFSAMSVIYEMCSNCDLSYNRHCDFLG